MDCYGHSRARELLLAGASLAVFADHDAAVVDGALRERTEGTINRSRPEAARHWHATLGVCAETRIALASSLLRLCKRRWCRNSRVQYFCLE